MNQKTWCLQIWGVNTLSCLQYKNIIVDKNQSIPYFPPHYGIQWSIPSKVCPLRKRLPLSCLKNSSQIFDATKLWKHTIPLTYNTQTLISNISETHRFSPQMRLIAYPDHKTTLIHVASVPLTFIWLIVFLLEMKVLHPDLKIIHILLSRYTLLVNLPEITDWCLAHYSSKVYFNNMFFIVRTTPI